MKVLPEFISENPLALDMFLKSVPSTFTYVTRTMLDEWIRIFKIAGWVCESDADTTVIVKMLADEGLVSLLQDHRDRISQIKRNIPV